MLGGGLDGGIGGKAGTLYVLRGVKDCINAEKFLQYCCKWSTNGICVRVDWPC